MIVRDFRLINANYDIKLKTLVDRSPCFEHGYINEFDLYFCPALITDEDCNENLT